MKPVYVVSNGEQVELLLNGKSLGKGKRESHFLFTFDKVAYQPGRLEAVSYDGKGREVSRYTLSTVGEAARLELTAMQNPEGFHADGADWPCFRWKLWTRTADAVRWITVRSALP